MLYKLPVPDGLSKFSKISKSISSSEEVYDVSISWNYILLSVTDNFGLGRWAKIERNDGKPLRVLRHHLSIEEHTRENSESVKLYARIVWTSLKSSLEIASYDCLPHRVSLKLQPPLFSVENWIEEQLSTRVWTCNFFNFNFSSFGCPCFMIVLWLEIRGFLSRYFLLFNSAISAVTA